MHLKSHFGVPAREGITLLFTISMLVLFLMMGTAFVVVANNYYRSAIRRGRHNSINRDTTAWLDQAFYDAVRGPSLEHAVSPLRGHSILEDLYGYGLKGTLSDTASFQPSSNNALVVLQLDPSSLTTIRDGIILEDYLSSEAYVDGILNGRVITLTSGKAKGYSTRIVSHAAIKPDEDDTATAMLQVVIPRDETGIQWSDVEAEDEFIINGREFSGFGAGEIADHEIDPDADPLERLVSDENESEPIDITKATASRPNRIGERFEELIAEDGYLSSDKSPNEPWDAPDQHNMFLSGMFGEDNEVIPSFHRDRLYDYQYRRTSEALDGTEITASHIRRFSFRPVHIGPLDSTATPPQRPGANTANPQSWFGRYQADGSLDPTVAINSNVSLDVDTDMDGRPDAVWIDIGLPDQIDAEGYKFRPLVAYRIIDLDGRLNLNAHGLLGDTKRERRGRTGTGYGVAEISLSDTIGDNYESLIVQRYGADEQAGARKNSLTPNYFPTQKMFGHPRINTKTSYRFGTAADFFASNSYTMLEGDDEAMPEYIATTGFLSDQNPYLSDFSLRGGVGDSLFNAQELEGILRRGDVDGALLNSRLGIFGDAVDSVTTHSFEIAIPATTTSILELLRNKIALEFEDADQKTIFNIFTSDRYIDPDTEDEFEMKYISKDMLMGGRFNLIPIIGNGVDNNLDGVIDNSVELARGTESSRIPGISKTQFGNPVYDLNNDPETDDSTVKSLMAKQLYLLALLTCGDAAPEGYPSGPLDDEGLAIVPVSLYRKSVAQWAVNVVDFYDPDSIMTVFEYDVNPFNDPREEENRVDGDPRTDESTERGVVYGAERPEILITETFAHHDRQNEDTFEDSTGETTDGGDPDWDGGRVPQSSLYVELYHPHRQTSTTDDPVQGFQLLPFELSDQKPPQDLLQSLRTKVKGVDMGILAPDDTPVWRIAVHRGPEADDADEHVRTIYFADPVNSKAPDPLHDCFFPKAELGTIEPNNDSRCYMVLGPDGNVGNGQQTFGRLTSTDERKDPTPREIAQTRAITLSATSVSIRDFDGARTRKVLTRNCIGSTIQHFRSGHSGPIGNRGLSLSDPDGGYPIDLSNVDATKSADGITLKTPNDEPFDAEAPEGNRDRGDMGAIWTNGIKQDSGYQFRVLKLQRLADPLSDFHTTANPYVTIDLANVDLLAFNGLQKNPTNEVNPDIDDSFGLRYVLQDQGTTLGGIERGEQIAEEESPEAARRQFYRALGRVEVPAENDAPNINDNHNFSFRFTDGDVGSAGDMERHETLGGRNGSFDDTNQYSWLMWNNRPYANTMELANVPMLSAEGIVRHFNRSESETEPIGANESADRAFSYFFGDDQFGHIMAFGNVERGGIAQPNRFGWMWEFVEVPNRFLGSETWLVTRDIEGEPIFVPSGGALKFNLHPPWHSIPNFRYPGKVNLNTVYQEGVWKGLTRGFSDLEFQEFREDRETPIGASDFGHHYTTAESAEFTDNPDSLRKGAAANLFRKANGSDTFLTDGVNDDEHGAGTDVEASAFFRNEFRTRLGVAATTRSNVYAIWISLGYFEVDDFGRVGPEIGSDEGLVHRNRAFYIVDRSIPVASEPGENHNVDNAVLTRTIIE